MLDAQDMERKGRMVLAQESYCLAKTREKVAGQCSSSKSEHIWVIIKIAWISSVARVIPESITYLPKCFSMKLERK